jgi:hypothetical protein
MLVIRVSRGIYEHLLSPNRAIAIEYVPKVVSAYVRLPFNDVFDIQFLSMTLFDRQCDCNINCSDIIADLELVRTVNSLSYPETSTHRANRIRLAFGTVDTQYVHNEDVWRSRRHVLLNNHFEFTGTK